MEQLTKTTINSIKIEQAELLNRLLIDAPLSDNDIKIGLCMLHEIILTMAEGDIEATTD